MRKMIEAQFVLQGTESNIKRIEKEIAEIIAEISTHEEVIASNSKIDGIKESEI